MPQPSPPNSPTARLPNHRSRFPKPTCVLILAAGESSRYGYFPKQLLEFEGRSLIRRAAETALASKTNYVVTVLGANSEKVLSEIADLPVRIVVNDDWRSGMGSSISAGMRVLSTEIPDLEKVCILLADQPLVRSEDLDRLFEAAGDAAIAASSYGGTAGAPAVFNQTLFGELQDLDPSKGAREIIARKREVAVLVDLPAALTDIDRPSDLDALRNITVTDN